MSAFEQNPIHTRWDRHRPRTPALYVGLEVLMMTFLPWGASLA